MQAQSLSISTAASYAGMISAGVNVSNSQDKSLATSFTSEITDKQTFSKGNILTLKYGILYARLTLLIVINRKSTTNRWKCTKLGKGNSFFQIFSSNYI